MILLRSIERGLDDFTKSLARVWSCTIKRTLGCMNTPCVVIHMQAGVGRTYLVSAWVDKVVVFMKLPDSIVSNGVELEGNEEDLMSKIFLFS